MYLMKLDNSFLKSCKDNAKNRLGDEDATVKITSDIEKFLCNE